MGTCNGLPLCAVHLRPRQASLGLSLNDETCTIDTHVFALAFCSWKSNRGMKARMRQESNEESNGESEMTNGQHAMRPISRESGDND